MSVGIGTQISVTSGWAAGAIAEHRLLASLLIMAASCGYHSLRVLELDEEGLQLIYIVERNCLKN